ncbi:STAS domain-containing protein [Rhodococcus fascians]|uniref:STAS domain-containing protein n=1 Tax=Rhodococcoides fascians TaxID=1828 RepID=UPI00195C3A53|nr:STAS domain-containing protein [Rhodococcus fascians]MBM7242518.1 STAS domain-containing protein [Rhodococcus fascians]MBY3809743.1 STAS domain-containing protein [Rhodococcus fascians]MBY3840666.1 STAS domain-containing protein [Rhodococcus fascians]MBY3847157.1 STAS domain-containing protein [Rhodococcus fascians]MBY3849706.1 STAS domain-containing protein [Rhodococcus fascians]
MTVSDFTDVRSTAPARRHSIGIESYSPDLTVVRAVGELDMSARADLVNALDGALRGNAVVLLDLSAVDFMYSGAASVIVDAVERSDGRVEVFAPTRPARRVLDAVGAGFIGEDPSAR